ncbi:MAG TPA: phosphotransferase [Pseudomonas sp.]|nr:phosphotransferase [Pseudomonas sp.]
MLHLKPLTSGFSPIKLHDIHFLIAEGRVKDVQAVLESFFLSPHSCTTLDPLEETRGVYLLQGAQQWVLKHNHLTSWKKQLVNFFGIKKTYGLHDLTNEFINLQKISAVADFVPRVFAYGYRTRRLCFLQEEYLLIGYFAEHCDVDERLQSSPEQAERVLEQIFELFSRMLALGFCHLDPHPKNIMIGPDNQLRLIDFECCSHKVLSQDFALGFLHGYFYAYWFKRFIDKDLYHRLSSHYLARAHPGLDRGVFEPVYRQFRDHKVGRSTRYSVMTSAAAQRAFLASLTR